MCVGHPKRHPCQHTSVSYNHCVSARFDRTTGLTTPCTNTTYAAPIDTESKCTNQLCYFQELGRMWICCKCNNGPNGVGWCSYDRPRVEVNAITGQAEQLTACDHCCCWNCTSYPSGAPPSSSRSGSSKHKKHHSSKHKSSSHGGSSGHAGGAHDYQWIEMDYGTKGSSSSSHKKRKNKER